MYGRPFGYRGVSEGGRSRYRSPSEGLRSIGKYKGHLAIVEYLKEAGADLNCTNEVWSSVDIHTLIKFVVWEYSNNLCV